MKKTQQRFVLASGRKGWIRMDVVDEVRIVCIEHASHTRLHYQSVDARNSSRLRGSDSDGYDDNPWMALASSAHSTHAASPSASNRPRRRAP